ncbi:serine/threonine protein kinase [Chroococcidiopsis sp. FACHB-1243]|uniref:serine/threonine-protein kinase n=1 Tax=Chroococcidiopsis sp. [FACHB-1243] TaxID=2692781 RepID=UPI0017832F71|nr:serine/threonine-protein kinase [Chroococcidiopsis sp. [FACHB-1243]]MBD2308727.1 serine/threonine protein kinase [Chroococcidiopsis sp. [FACHB-1243]]
MPDPFVNQSDAWIGRTIGDRQRYRLDRRVGAGGMGDVFLAMDTLLGQQVALKLLKDTLVTSLDLKKRFEREVAVSAALKSDHIVEVSDYGVTAEGFPFYVMEYLRGQSLGQLLRQQRQLSIERTVNIITQVCDGLSLAHEGVTLWREKATVKEHIQVVHRDLKPDNIFLVPTTLGELVKILDFGIAKIREDRVEYTQLTNMFLGTFHYAAPEQIEVEKDIDGRADIYSLGIILYEMLSGTDPFGLGLNTRSINQMSWALAHTSKPVKPLRSQPSLSNLSPVLEAVVLRCLNKAPSDRFASVNDLKIALQVATTVETETVLPPRTQHDIEDKTTNKTTIRPLTPLSPIVTKSTNINNSTVIRPMGDRTIERPIEPVAPGVTDTILSLGQDSLLEIITEIIGPIASTLIEEIAAQTSSTKELVENLFLYLSTSQQIEFEKKARGLLQKSGTQTRTGQTQAIDANFLQQCEEYLAEIIGPIASSLIQEVMETYPQISPADLVNMLAEKIPNAKQSKKFSRQLIG